MVRAQTDFTQNINMLFENFKGMTSKIISYDSRVEINYYINIPEYLNLKIENKYGDVYMENNTGDLSISVSNGSFKANSLGKGSHSQTCLLRCNYQLTLLQEKLMPHFQRFQLAKPEDLSFNSISSRYDIKKAGMISVESRRDKFFIDNIGITSGKFIFHRL